jgi:hypothetical protein
MNGFRDCLSALSSIKPASEIVTSIEKNLKFLVLIATLELSRANENARPDAMTNFFIASYTGRISKSWSGPSVVSCVDSAAGL